MKKYQSFKKWEIVSGEVTLSDEISAVAFEDCHIKV